MSDPLLSVRDLSVGFDSDEGFVRAVDRVSFEVMPGEVLGLVGESGCGKSVTAMSLLRLVPSPPGRVISGSAVHQGRDLLRMPIAELRSLRGRGISMIFQEPMTSLSPLMSIGRQLAETLHLHESVGEEDAWRRSQDWLARTGIPDPGDCMRRLPHQLSGGMRQRVTIAMALMLNPDLVIADEPTTALDVTVQAQIFDLLLHLRSKDASVLLITHDMGAVWEVCDRVMVMYAAQLVEEGPVREVFAKPLHPYTRGLLRALPGLGERRARLDAIPGQVPAAGRWPAGCRFSDRCPLAFDRCRAESPELEAHGPGRRAACFLAAREGATP
jgi:peptide/nickel transport system ATP-binding protein/oligopeptide transport system ATP-binding protein